MSYEYRVTWRREHDKTKRRRIYQTRAGAESFFNFLDGSTWEEADLDDYAIDNLRRLGDPVEVRVEVRPVGDWRDWE